MVGEPAAGASTKAARAGAALALLRDLAPPAPHAPVHPDRSSADRNPVSVLNERVQTGAITDLSYAQDAEGPAHQPMFTCTVSCTDATGSQSYAAAGRSKNEAKAAAAAGLLEQLSEAERSAAAALARAAEAEARSPQGIFGRLLKAGCALDFRRMDRRSASAIRQAVSSPGRWRAGRCRCSPRCRPWPGPPSARCRRTRRRRPGRRPRGRPSRRSPRGVCTRPWTPTAATAGGWSWLLTRSTVWRRTPGREDGEVVASGLTDFLDAVADALLRPPGARLVIGDTPYAGRPRVLAGAAAEWADHAAEMADPARRSHRPFG